MAQRTLPLWIGDDCTTYTEYLQQRMKAYQRQGLRLVQKALRLVQQYESGEETALAVVAQVNPILMQLHQLHPGWSALNFEAGAAILSPIKATQLAQELGKLVHDTYERTRNGSQQ